MWVTDCKKCKSFSQLQEDEDAFFPAHVDIPQVALQFKKC